MAEQYQFGNRLSNRTSQNLEHYRLQIRRLQQKNLLQAQAYTKKIQFLENQLKNPHHQPSQSASSAFHNYQSPGTTNLQILKRDKQINKLSQENQRLRKQMHINPDHELIIKNKRSFFDELADKDAQIKRLQKCIYELQSKYDGKYYNDARIKNQYQILQQQNKKLRKQLQSYANTSKPLNTQINTQLLQCIHYKKQAELLGKENQYLKAQYKKIDQQYRGYRNSLNDKVVVGSQIQLLKRDLEDSRRKNEELVVYIKQIEAQNANIKRQLQELKIGAKPNQTMQRSQMSSNGDSSRKRARIFKEQHQSELAQSQFIQPYQPPPHQIQSQITGKQPQSPNRNSKPSLPPTEKKSGGFYDKYNISRFTNRGSQVH